MNKKLIERFTKEANPPEAVLKKVNDPKWFNPEVQRLVDEGVFTAEEVEINGEACIVVLGPEGEVVFFENTSGIEKYAESTAARIEKIENGVMRRVVSDANAKKVADELRKMGFGGSEGNA